MRSHCSKRTSTKYVVTMNCKRQSIDDDDTLQRKRKPNIDEKISSRYEGYKISDKDVKIDEVEVPKTPEEVAKFFKEYVVARKPCIIRGISPTEFPLKDLHPNKIESTLPTNEILTIEKKSAGGFGSGAKRMKMSFGQFIDCIKNKNNTDLYLTTQYYEDDPNNCDYSTDEDEASQVLNDIENCDTSSLTFENTHDDFDDLEADYDNDINVNEDPKTDDDEEYEIRLKELYQPPMTNLVNSLPEQPEFLSYLIPQQINLWIGAVSNVVDDSTWLEKFDPKDPKLGLGRNVPRGGSSSGLHHDHADNIYIPISGHKRFTLFSPSDAAKMYTVGEIREVFSSGVIDYFRNDLAPSWRQLRDDGAIVAEVYKKTLESDLKCSQEERKLYEKFIEDDMKGLESNVNVNLDPPSFSTVPTAVVHIDKIEDLSLREKIKDISRSKWPLFFKANRITVDVAPGDMLFLPTGWFHEVTSFGGKSDKENVHVAANYWFIPPNGISMENVYSHKDNYWIDDYKITKKALSKAREGVL